ncbi:MAG: helix-turn-helix domain-containing protein [Pseudonocardiaceae bacterium]
MSSSTLHRIEHGQRPVTLTELVALANALEIAPSELTRLPVPAPANGHTDSTTETVRLTLDAIDIELLDLAVYLHVHITRQWLVHGAAPTDLVRRAGGTSHHIPLPGRRAGRPSGRCGRIARCRRRAGRAVRCHR